MSWIQAFASLLLASSLTGCGQECTAAACTDRVRVTFGKSISVADGYIASVDADGVVTSCSVARAGGACTNAEFTVVVQDSQLRELWVEGKPKQLKVTITSPTAIVTRELTPKYEKLYPNGEDCAGTCMQAEATID